MEPLGIGTLHTWLEACDPFISNTSVTVSGVAVDSRHVMAGDAFFALQGKRQDGHGYIGTAFDRGASVAVVAADRLSFIAAEHPGRPLLAVDDTTAALGRLANRWRRHVAARVVAITGSCGKTTTKDMLALCLGERLRCAVAPASYNNDVGLPLALLSLRSNDEVAVVEVGTNAPGEVASLAAIAEPDIAIITCIGEAHLEGLGSRDGVLAEKLALVEGLRRHGRRLAVLGSDDPELWDEANRLRGLPHGPEVITAGIREHSDLRGILEHVGAALVRARVAPGGPIMRLRAPGGAHLIRSALLAMAAGEALGVPLEESAHNLLAFRPRPGRFKVTRVRGVTLIDDTYNANPTSLSAALESASTLACKRRFLVLGDMRELGSAAAVRHREAGRKAASLQPEQLIAVGELGRELMAGALDAGLSPSHALHVDAPEDASDAIASRLGKGDLVLFKASRGVALERAVERVSKELRRRPTGRRRRNIA